MKRMLSLLFIVVIILLIGMTVFSTVLFLAEDDTEGVPGVDMAATWNLSGINWIYPGSTHNAEGATLHNIHEMSNGKHYENARDMMEYTYGVSPHIIVVMNTKAAEKVFGKDIVSQIRGYDYAGGYDRAPAIESAIGDFGINPLQIIPCLLTGDIHIEFV